MAVLSYHFWQGHYGDSPAAVGKTIQLDKENYTIIGVVPPRFEWFHSDLYISLHLGDDPDRVEIVDARLKPGVSIERATAALTPLVQAFEKESPKHFPPQPGLRIRKLNATTEDRYQRTFVLIFCAVMVLLAVGSTNVALLLLARATGRQQEFSVRAALGASRARLIRQLVSEAILLAAVGCRRGIGAGFRPANRAWLAQQLLSEHRVDSRQRNGLAVRGGRILVDGPDLRHLARAPIFTR